MVLCEVLFIIVLLVLFVKICVRVYQDRLEYFRQFWSILDVIVFSLGIVAVVTYMGRYFLAQETLGKFTKNVQFYVNFDHVVWWDRLFSVVIGALNFLVTIKFLLVLQELKTVRTIVQIFERCRQYLIWNGSTFLLILVGFALLRSYNGLLSSMETLFVFLIGKSKFSEINDTSPILAKLFFFVFTLVSVFFFMNIVMSVLGTAIDDVVQHNRKHMSKDLVHVLLATVKGFFAPKRNRSSSDRYKYKRKGHGDRYVFSK